MAFKLLLACAAATSGVHAAAAVQDPCVTMTSTALDLALKADTEVSELARQQAMSYFSSEVRDGVLVLPALGGLGFCAQENPQAAQIPNIPQHLKGEALGIWKGLWHARQTLGFHPFLAIYLLGKYSVPGTDKTLEDEKKYLAEHGWISHAGRELKNVFTTSVQEGTTPDADACKGAQELLVWGGIVAAEIGHKGHAVGHPLQQHEFQTIKDYLFIDLGEFYHLRKLEQHMAKNKDAETSFKRIMDYSTNPDSAKFRAFFEKCVGVFSGANVVNAVAGAVGANGAQAATVTDPQTLRMQSIVAELTSRGCCLCITLLLVGLVVVIGALVVVFLCCCGSDAEADDEDSM